MSEYVIVNGELMHYGVKGQKWGKRRYQNPDGTLTPEGKARYKEFKKDIKQYKSLRRHVGATAKNLKFRAKNASKSKDEFDEASDNYTRELSRFSFSKTKKQERIDSAEKDLSAVGKKYEDNMRKYDIAKKVYDDRVKALSDHLNDVVKRHGRDSVDAIPYKNKKLAEHYVEKMLDTGWTVSDIPIISTWYGGMVSGDYERLERERRYRNNAANKW